jgi:threonine dehydratase
MIPYSWLEQAAERIAPYVKKTPIIRDAENQIYLKLENQQVTGSFKVRGAINKVLTLQDWEREKGLVTASAGNHGQGVALAGKLVEAQVIIFASEHAVPAKIEAMQALGAEVRLVEGGYGEAEEAGLAYAASGGSTWISPYNDGQVIAGQGTVGLEILDQIPDLPNSTWVVPVGGGGLISGIGAAIKTDAIEKTTSRKLIAAQSEASAFMHAIFRHGSQDEAVDLPSLADGLAGPVEANSITIPLVRRYVDEFVLVSEGDIAAAIAYAWKRYHERIEGSAAAALATVLSGKISSRPAIIVISGGNIQAEVHAEILGRYS